MYEGAHSGILTLGGVCSSSGLTYSFGLSWSRVIKRSPEPFMKSMTCGGDGDHNVECAGTGRCCCSLPTLPAALPAPRHPPRPLRPFRHPPATITPPLPPATASLSSPAPAPAAAVVVRMPSINLRIPCQGTMAKWPCADAACSGVKPRGAR